MLVVDAQAPAKRPSVLLAGITSGAAFFLLRMTTALPLFNGANAVVELIRSTGGAF